MMDIEDRREAVRSLIQLAGQLGDLVEKVRLFPWDCEEELASLGGNDIRRATESFLRGEISAADLDYWANAVEGRDDIEFVPNWTLDLVAELANPVLFGAITKESAKSFLVRIDALEGTGDE